MKKGLTIIELLVVIGIIAVLTGVLLGTFAGGTESARAARCLSNLKNLASAAQVAGTSGNAATQKNSYMPLAGSKQIYSADSSEGSQNVTEKYTEERGWISWDSRNAYPSSSGVAKSSWTIPMYEENDERRLYALTNGVIWKYTGGNRNVYVCPSHTQAKKQLNPNYSYVMNPVFGWSPDPAEDLWVAEDIYPNVDRAKAERRLLFAEIPFADIGHQPQNDGAYEVDAILQYHGCTDEGSFEETIGFNHKSGNFYCAHIVFQDGHIDKLRWPKEGLSESQERELAEWLCEGEDVAFDGKKYVKMEN